MNISVKISGLEDMDFETWWEKEGSVMFEGDCSAKIIANAAWQASDKMMELGMEVLKDPTVSETRKAMVRTEMRNQKKLMKTFGMSSDEKDN